MFKSNVLAQQKTKSSICGHCRPLISPSNRLIQPVREYWTGYQSVYLHSCTHESSTTLGRCIAKAISELNRIVEEKVQQKFPKGNITDRQH